MKGTNNKGHVGMTNVPFLFYGRLAEADLEERHS